MARLAPFALAALLLAGAGCESAVTRERAVRDAFRAYRNALESQDLAALRDVVAAERRPSLDALGAENTIAMIAAMRPKEAEVVETKIDGDAAEIVLAGVLEGAPMTGVVRLRREDGAWKLVKEEWSIRIVAGGFGSPGSGDFAARLKSGPQAAPSATMRLSGHEGKVTSVAFTPDGVTLVTASYDDSTIRTWDLRSRSQVDAVTSEHRPTDMIVCPDGTVVVADAYGNMTKLPLQQGELGEPREIDGDAARISRIALHPEGTVIASTGWKDPVRLWDLAAERNRCLGRSDSMRGIAFSPDGRWLAAGGHDNTFTVWDLERRWAPRRTHEVSWADEQSEVWAIAFSPDGALLATGHLDSSISIWDVKHRKERKNWYVRDAATQDVDFSPDGTLLATAQQNGSIYLWDAGTAQELAKLPGHEGAATSLAFSPVSPEVFASGGEDGAVVVWQ